MFDASRRPIGRLSYWVMAAMMIGGLVQSASAAGAVPQSGPATTTVVDTVYLADGSRAQGNLIITWPAFLTENGTAIAGGTKNVALGTSGALSVELVPNAGANPAGVYYTVVYQLGPGQTRSESWVVPTTTPANLAAVRMTPGSGMAGQPVSMQYVDSELATKANDSAVVHLDGTETISGAKTFAAAPSVPAPTSTGQVANKGYVDASISNVGAGNYLSTSGGTMTGPITLPANPVAGMQAATKQYVDQGFSTKADLLSGLVPVNELGAGAASAGNCLLGNGTWGACGSGGGPTGVANGSALVSNGVGQAAVYQAKPVVDVRDYGVVGDGCTNLTHDETTAFQAAMNAAIGTPQTGVSGKLIIPGGMCINVSSTLNIYGARGLVVECQGAQGQAVNRCGINWIGPAGGTVIAINQTRDSKFSGFFVSTGQYGSSTSANVAIDVDETGTNGGITSHDTFKDIILYQYPTTNPNFIGMRFGNLAPGNVEGMDLENVSAQCHGTPTGIHSTGTAFQVGKTGGLSEPFYVHFHGNQEVSNCSIGWDLQGMNRLVTIDGGLTGGNYYLLYYEAGSQAVLKNIRDEGSTFIAGMLANAVDLTVENLSISGLSPGQTSFDLTNAGSGTRLYIKNTQWDNVAMTPISPNTGGSSVTVLERNVYPNGACPDLTQFSGFAMDTFSQMTAGFCPNRVGGNAWTFQPSPTTDVPNINFLGTAGSSANASSVANIDTPSGSQQSTLRIGNAGVSQFQVCHQPGPQGEVVFGSAVACPSIYTSTFAKNVFQSGTGTHQLMRAWQASTSQTGAFMDMNTATAAGTGFNFFEGWTGVTGTDTFHTGGTKTFAIQGDGSYVMNGCGSGTYLKADGTGCGTPAGGSGSMVYPGVGIPQSTGTGWGTSYAVGAAAGNLLALDGSANLTLPGNLTINGQFSVAGPWAVSSAPSTTAMAAASAGHSSLGISNDGNFYISANAGSPNQVVTQLQASATTPSMDGTGAAGTSTSWARADHVHPSDTSKVSTSVTVNGHALTSNVTLSASDLTTGTLPNGTIATTQTAGDNSTKLATTAYVKNEVYLVWSCTPNSFTTVGNFCAWTTPAAITVTGFDYSNIGAITCTTYPVVAVWDATAGAVVGVFTLTLTNSGSNWNVTGSTNVPAGHVLRIRTSTAAVGCSSGGLGASVTYQMQN